MYQKYCKTNRLIRSLVFILILLLFKSAFVFAEGLSQETKDTLDKIQATGDKELSTLAMVALKADHLLQDTVDEEEEKYLLATSAELASHITKARTLDKNDSQRSHLLSHARTLATGFFEKYRIAFPDEQKSLFDCIPPQSKSNPVKDAEKSTLEVVKHWNLEDRIKKLKNLASNHDLHLLVGRKSDEQGHGSLPDDKKVIWVYGDISETSLLKENDPIQLTMDFKDKEKLGKIGKSLFSQIIFDISAPIFDEVNTPEYFEMLKKNGKLVLNLFDAHNLTVYSQKPNEFQSGYQMQNRFPFNYVLDKSLITDDTRRRQVLKEIQSQIVEKTKSYLLKIGFSQVNVKNDENYPISWQNRQIKRSVFIEAIK